MNSAARRSRPEPQDLRHDAVAEDHRPGRHPVRPERAQPERALLRLDPAVPRDEVLGAVRVTHDDRGQQDEPRHVLEVVVGDVLLEAEDPAHRDHHREHHREAREDRAGHEVGAEDRRVPAGDDRHREVPGHHAVHREHERRGEAREVQHRPVVRLPTGFEVPASRATARRRAPDASPSRGRGRSRGRGSARRTRTDRDRRVSRDRDVSQGAGS